MAETLEALEDWEDWDPESGTSFFVHAAAGSLAGAAEHCAMFPVDTVKTHIQASSRGSLNPIPVATNLLKESTGPLRLWRGVSTMLGACIPAHAFYFSIFEQMKHSLGADGSEHAPIASGLSGACATIAHDAIMTPMDVIKQRLQLGFYTGTLDCFRTVVRTEGFGALYLSFPTTLMMNIPFASVMVATNETVKKIINPNNVYNVQAFVTAGAISGAVAALVTNPLDVAKTRLQTQNLLSQFPNCEIKSNQIPIKSSNPSPKAISILSPASYISHPKGFGVRATYTMREKVGVDCGCKGNGSFLAYDGFASTVRKIYSQEGARGFARGAFSRVLVQAPSVAISWTTYETFKKLFS